jgi:hypothetical protein
VLRRQESRQTARWRTGRGFEAMAKKKAKAKKKR